VNELRGSETTGVGFSVNDKLFIKLEC
jgi:hypothetical protein